MPSTNSRKRHSALVKLCAVLLAFGYIFPGTSAAVLPLSAPKAISPLTTAVTPVITASPLPEFNEFAAHLRTVTVGTMSYTLPKKHGKHPESIEITMPSSWVQNPPLSTEDVTLHGTYTSLYWTGRNPITTGDPRFITTIQQVTVKATKTHHWWRGTPAVKPGTTSAITIYVPTDITTPVRPTTSVWSYQGTYATVTGDLAYATNQLPTGVASTSSTSEVATVATPAPLDLIVTISGEEKQNITRLLHAVGEGVAWKGRAAGMEQRNITVSDEQRLNNTSGNVDGAAETRGAIAFWAA